VETKHSVTTAVAHWCDQKRLFAEVHVRIIYVQRLNIIAPSKQIRVIWLLCSAHQLVKLVSTNNRKIITAIHTCITL